MKNRNKKIKVAFFDTKPYDKKFFELANEKYGYDITYFDIHLTPQTVELTKGFQAVCVFVNDTLNKEIVDDLISNEVKLITLRCAGYNNIDLKAAFHRITISHVPTYSPYAVAEHTVALMLSLNRHIHRAYYRIRDINFSINGFLGFDMYKKTVGIVGMGRIAEKLIPILKGFGMKILVYDIKPNPLLAESKQIEYVTLNELYKKSDVITLHCPLTSKTHHLINKKAIQEMKDGMMIINTSRGGLIDTNALVQGLKSHKVGAAGLDVYEEESEYFFEDFSSETLSDDTLARLLTFPNVLITSHQAFFTKEAIEEIATTTLKNIDNFFNRGRGINKICFRCG